MIDYGLYLGFLDPIEDKRVLKDVMNRYRTNLFYEFNQTAHDEYPPIYTMRESEWHDLPSAYQIYMHSDTEYEAAQKLVGSWTHWNRLLQIPSFMNGPKGSYQWSGLNAWREEKEIQDTSKALSLLKIAAEGGNVTAQKIIYDSGTKKRGRPSNAEIRKAAEKAAQEKKELKDDYKRITLVASNGDTTGNH